ncbi:hypothetical protein LIER_40655 [Lithospermum erythrorhizon]|uniref:BHLH domain-containing protein n=1 Tax=Lithospermum erythrorhizon TaxID=34254 RepID=A0AAV3QXN2_LITER
MGSTKAAFSNIDMTVEAGRIGKRRHLVDELGEGDRMGRMTHIDNDEGDEYNDDSVFKSKNLKAERKRRKKLSDRLLELRSLVPNITNAMIKDHFH